MERNKSHLIDFLSQAMAQRPFNKITFAEKTPLPKAERVEYLPWHRFTLVLAGRTKLTIALDGEYKDIWITPGDVIVFAPFCWCERAWEKDDSHEGLSIVLERNHLRIVYSDYLKESKSYWPPTYYYHIEDSLSPGTINAVKTLTSMKKTPSTEEYIRELIHAALGLTLCDLKSSESHHHGKAYTSWLKVSKYVEDNYNCKITRELLRKEFKLSEVYISKLFKRYSFCTLNEFLTRIRLENASKLLNETDMNVDEIAWRCGYQCTSFFIKIFRKMHSVTPTVYRQINLKHNTR